MDTETPSPPKAFTKSDQWLDLVKAFEHRDVIAAKAFTKNDQWLVLVKEMRGYQSRDRSQNRIWDTGAGGPAATLVKAVGRHLVNGDGAKRG